MQSVGPILKWCKETTSLLNQTGKAKISVLQQVILEELRYCIGYSRNSTRYIKIEMRHKPMQC